MIFRNRTLFLQFYAYRTKEVFSHLQVYTIYLVNYYIRKLAHESLLLLCSKHKIVKSKFFDQKLSKHVNSAKMQNKSPRTILHVIKVSGHIITPLLRIFSFQR